MARRCFIPRENEPTRWSSRSCVANTGDGKHRPTAAKAALEPFVWIVQSIELGEEAQVLSRRQFVVEQGLMREQADLRPRLGGCAGDRDR